jgi:hypothetical protein
MQAWAAGGMASAGIALAQAKRRRAKQLEARRWRLRNGETERHRWRLAKAV